MTSTRTDFVSSGMAPCPMCGNPGVLVLIQEDLFLGIRPELKHELYRCNGCDVYYQKPISPELLGEFYPESYYTQSRRPAFLDVVGRFRVQRRADAVEWHAKKGSALDVGCGRGLLLAELKRRGWSVVGTDWNATNARSVSERLGIRVLGGEGALDQLEPGSFQAISLLHVLEHDGQPLDLLRRVHRLLETGGRLLIAVPNGRSLARVLFGRFWMGYDIPRHRCVFTPRSVRQCLDAVGFQVERVTGRLTDEWLDTFRSCQLLCKSMGWYNRILQAMVASVAAVPLTLASAVGFGSVVYVYAQKS